MAGRARREFCVWNMEMVGKQFGFAAFKQAREKVTPGFCNRPVAGGRSRRFPAASPEVRTLSPGQLSNSPAQLSLSTGQLVGSSVQLYNYSLQLTDYCVQLTDYFLQLSYYSLQLSDYSLHFSDYSLQLADYSGQLSVSTGQFFISAGQLDAPNNTKMAFIQPFRPKTAFWMGSAPATGAVFRALAENPVRTEQSATVRGSIRPDCWPRGRACSPTSEFGLNAGFISVPGWIFCPRGVKLLACSVPALTCMRVK